MTDVILPGIGGPVIAERLRQSHPTVKIVYMSGYSGELITHHGIEELHAVLLEKPFRIGLLLQKIREALDDTAPKLKAAQA